MRNSAYAKPFNLDFKSICDAYTFYWRVEKSFEILENVKKLKLGGGWVEFWVKIFFLRESYTKWVEQIKPRRCKLPWLNIFSKTGNNLKTLIFSFAYLWTAIARVYLIGDMTLGFAFTQIWCLAKKALI